MGRFGDTCLVFRLPCWFTAAEVKNEGNFPIKLITSVDLQPLVLRRRSGPCFLKASHRLSYSETDSQ